MRRVFAVEGRLSERVPYPVEEIPGHSGAVWVMDSGWDPIDGIRPAADG
jgi:hypothetical protein